MLTETTARPPVPVPTTGDPPSLTIVTCVEAGPLEPMVLRMVASLRRWGGRLRDCPVLALNPRFGPPLARATRHGFEALNITYRRIHPENPYPWMGFYNKPVTVAVAQTEVATEQVAFLDADVFILGEPSELVLGPNEDFTAAAPDKTLGTCGPDDPNEPYWKAVCALVGLTVDDLPWVVTCQEHARIRLYWQGGVFVYRRSTRFAQSYLDIFTQINRSGVVSHASRSFFNDQVSISLAMVKEGLRWRALSHSHNYNVLGPLLAAADPETWKPVRVLHYHDALWPAYWPELLKQLAVARPDVHDWLAPQGPLTNPRATPWKALNKVLKLARARRYQAYEATCRAF